MIEQTSTPTGQRIATLRQFFRSRHTATTARRPAAPPGDGWEATQWPDTQWSDTCLDPQAAEAS